MQPIPTITQITKIVSNDFKNKLNISTAYLKKTLNALAVVFSAQIYLVYLYLADVQNNIFPDTASSVEDGGTLERQGQIYLNRQRFQATIGVFRISVTGVAGSVLRENITFKSNEGSLNPGQLYVLDAEYICTGTSDIVTIRSLGSGSTFNLIVGDNLTITEPVIGIDKTVAVILVETQPTAQEDIEAYRRAILNAIQLEPQGGARSDYRQWATDAAGVRLVYPFVRDLEPSNVDIYVEATLIDSISNTGVPTITILNNVLAVCNYDPDISKAIYERGRKPAQAFLSILPITRIPVDIIITGLNVNTLAIRNTIKASIENSLYKIRPFISGADLQRNKNDILYYGKLLSIVTDSLSNGNFFNELEMQVDGNVEITFEFSLGNVPYLRNFTVI